LVRIFSTHSVYSSSSMKPDRGEKALNARVSAGQAGWLGEDVPNAEQLDVASTAVGELDGAPATRSHKLRSLTCVLDNQV